jgi:hypothetical protein
LHFGEKVCLEHSAPETSAAAANPTDMQPQHHMPAADRADCMSSQLGADFFCCDV